MTPLGPLPTKAVEQHSVEVEVARCSRGQYFGELALVTNKPRAASVYAVGETRCLGKSDAGVCRSLRLIFSERLETAVGRLCRGRRRGDGAAGLKSDAAETRANTVPHNLNSKSMFFLDLRHAHTKYNISNALRYLSIRET